MKPKNEPAVVNHPLDRQLSDLAAAEDHRGRIRKLVDRMKPTKQAQPVHPYALQYLGMNHPQLIAAARGHRKRRDQHANRALRKPAWETRAIGRKAEKAARHGILMYLCEGLAELLAAKTTVKTDRPDEKLPTVAAELKADTINVVAKQAIGRVRQEASFMGQPDAAGASVADDQRPPVRDRRTPRAKALAEKEHAHRQLVSALKRQAARDKAEKASA